MMKKRLQLLILPLTMIMVLGFATFCLASGGATLPIEPPAGETPVFGNLYAIAWTAVNFFALLAILYKFAFNPINSMLEERANSIESSLKQAETYKVEMEQMRNEAQVNLTESRKEAQEIIGPDEAICSSLTPNTIVSAPSPLVGALIITFLAPDLI